MPSQDTNYVDTYFDHKKLTKIHGEPTFQHLKDLKDQLRANAASVPSTLGGGLYGHLGLVLDPTEYTSVSGTPYVHPPAPPALTMPNGTPVHTALRLQTQHAEDKKLNRETISVEQALKMQIQDALEPIYLRTLKNTHTQKIHQSIPEILTFLFTRYGEVDHQAQAAKEDEIRTMVFHPADPLVTIFTPLEDLRELGTYARNPYSEAQIVNYGLTILKQTSDFEKYLETWYARPVVDQTWSNFKDHFEEAQRSLKKVRGTTMEKASFQHANVLIGGVKEEISHLKEIITQALEPRDNDENNPPVHHNVLPTPGVHHVPQYPFPPDYFSNFNGSTMNPDMSYCPQANAVSGDSPLYRLIQDLKNEVNELKLASNNSNGSSKKNSKRKVTHYCYTHGGGTHGQPILSTGTYKACKNPCPEHKSEANMGNKLGGSTKFC